MKTTEIQIPEPCHVPWQSMAGDRQRRFCESCAKDVVDISTMTERQARRFLGDHPNACIQMESLGGEVLFEAPKRQSASLSRPGPFLRRAVKAGAILGFGLASPALASGDTTSTGSLVEWVADWLMGTKDKAVEQEEEADTKDKDNSVIPEVQEKPNLEITTPPIIRLGGAPVMITRGEPMARPK